jgi:hypothetical protein
LGWNQSLGLAADKRYRAILPSDEALVTMFPRR